MAGRGPGHSVAALGGLHRRLVTRAQETDPSAVATILDLGIAVAMHGVLEDEVPGLLHPLLDGRVVAQLRREHDWLTEHLDLLDSLWRSEPDSPDLPPLSAAVLDRLTEHVARDHRLLYDSPRMSTPLGRGPADPTQSRT